MAILRQLLITVIVAPATKTMIPLRKLRRWRRRRLMRVAAIQEAFRIQMAQRQLTKTKKRLKRCQTSRALWDDQI